MLPGLRSGSAEDSHPLLSADVAKPEMKLQRQRNAQSRDHTATAAVIPLLGMGSKRIIIKSCCNRRATFYQTSVSYTHLTLPTILLV